MAPRELPRIILEGDEESARHMAREGIRQLDILKDLMGFRSLQQDVRRVEYIDGSRIVCTSQFGINTVTLYAPSEEVGGGRATVFIKVLTQNGRGEVGDPDGGAFFKQTAYWIYLNINEKTLTFTLHIAETDRPVPDKLIKYCSQCKYRYEDDEEDIIRDASLFHYQSSLIAEVGEDAVLAVVGHENCDDFHYLTETTYDGFTVNLFGSLSEDLSTFYFSLYKYRFTGPYIPPTERQLIYRVYDLEEDEEINTWSMRCSGDTPMGHIYKDNVITRDGKIGSWATTAINEEYIPVPIRTYKSCLSGNIHDCGSSYGYTTERSGWRATRTHKTFDLESRSFIDEDRMIAFHLSYLTKDYVVCKAKDEREYLYGSAWRAWDCECTCVACPALAPPSPFVGCYPKSTTMHATNKMNSWGGDYNYNLYNGVELLNTIIDEEEDDDLSSHYNPGWEDFWTGARYLFEKRFQFSQGCPPEGGYGSASGTGSRESLTGSVILADPDVDATIVQMVTDTTGTKDKYRGNCNLHGGGSGWLRTLCFYGEHNYVCESPTENMWLCSDQECVEGPEEDTFKRRNLGPIQFEMNMSGDHVLDLIKASFISYDQVSKCTVRGMKVCFNCWPNDSLEGDWKILLDHPDLGEWDIAAELQNLLADEECNIIETIVFVPEKEFNESMFC